MEKDNFEDQLRHIVAHTDQRNNSSTNRERVWANINPKNKSKKGWYYTTAIAVILFGSFCLLFNLNEEPKVMNIGGNTKIQIDPSLIREKTIGSSLKILSPAKKERRIVSKKKIETDITGPIKAEIIIPQKSIFKQIIVSTVPEEQKPIINNILEKKQSFTVEFKRGSFTEIKEDTLLYLANIVEKELVKLKPSFKKEN